ncbi:hypothetical protein L0P88_17750 [Muricauda sp. SCSIO 64092]|uniref:hypothetical protein n=1 Tax=Allomuricauda sp. SCSIO 64092 TaxID=2908842 RepID=UPI001FF0E7A9|nr:hypothetical protein [Muricauda sp. SCSIO 64092]UOY05772.1 hypothetical protein L0P88_17750 [Muricauda sp. SCSIO 64092]
MHTEKLASDLGYLQTNKDIYETEEDLWFKGYLLDSQYFVPSQRSKVLFIQLIEDHTNKPVWEERYEIENGFVDGHLILNDSLKEGSYTLTGYSSYTFFKNIDEFSFLKKIHIVKSIKNKTKPNSYINDGNLHFNTFPEGGYLISDIENKLAFKASDSVGVPKEISGTLFENNKPLLKFKSQHDGMGTLNFIPNYSKNYHIEINQTNIKHSLPKMLPDGIAMEVISNNNNRLVFKITQTKNLNSQRVYLRTQIRGIVYNIAIANLNRETQIQIPLRDLPQGIAEVTLFNEDLKPLAERLVYVNPHKTIYIDISENEDYYKVRDKITLKISASNEEKKPVIAHIGISVFDNHYQNQKDNKNILSHYYLSTQLKGRIYNPGYYFEENNENRLEALDLLLLTQGWRKYIWNSESVKKRNITSIVSDTIRAKIFTKGKVEKSKEYFINAFTGNKGKSKFIAVNSKNQFLITDEVLKMGEQAYIYLKPLTPQKPKYKIELGDASFDDINSIRGSKTIQYPLPKLYEEKSTSLENFIIPNKTIELEGVTVEAQKPNIMRDKYLAVLDSLTKIDMNTDYVCKSGILNCPIHEFDHTNNTLPIEGKSYEQYMGFEWKNGPGSSYRFKGLKTEKYRYPKFTEEYLLEKFNLRILKGYYGKREFFNPTYKDKPEEDVFPDYRNTLYWNPSIITDENGEAKISFYCSDITGKFIINIEGVSGEGYLGNEITSFIVRK